MGDIAILASAQDRVVSEVVASLERRDQAHHDASSREQRRRDVPHPFGLVLRSVHEAAPSRSSRRLSRSRRTVSPPAPTFP
jgi:hypothetical protein